jgi:hypothetical protein
VTRKLSVSFVRFRAPLHPLERLSFLLLLLLALPLVLHSTLEIFVFVVVVVLILLVSIRANVRLSSVTRQYLIVPGKRVPIACGKKERADNLPGANFQTRPSAVLRGLTTTTFVLF